MVLSNVNDISASDLMLDSDQEPSRTDNTQATAVVYSQPYPEAVEADQATSTFPPDWTKPSTSLPTLAATWPLHLPINYAQAAWLNSFLTNKYILNDVCQKHKKCGVGQDASKVYLYSQGCPAAVYCHTVLPWGHDTALMHVCCHYPKLGVWCPWVARITIKSGSTSQVVKAMPNTRCYSTESTPPRTLMFLITEQSGTGRAPPLS